MKRHIDNPYKVNWKMYGILGVIFISIMIIAVIWNDRIKNLFSDTIKNLAFGCVASIFVAFLIEIGNVKERNIKANDIYDATYNDLKCQILWYLKTWACLYSVFDEEKKHSEEKHTWIEWYELTKNKLIECNDIEQEKINFLKDELLNSVKKIEKTLEQINSQRYILNVNEVYDRNLEEIIRDYSFEFHAIKLLLERNYNKDSFWKLFDAAKNDLVNYIYNWIDIRYYNQYCFKPYDFGIDDSADVD